MDAGGGGVCESIDCGIQVGAVALDGWDDLEDVFK